MFAAKLAYSAAIQFLVSAGEAGIEITTAAALKPFLPHLTVAEIDALIKKVNRQKSNYSIALPALVVKDTILSVRIEPRKTGRGAHPARLRYMLALRLSDVKDKTTYIKRAVSFALKHWGDTLIADTWQSLVRVEIQDPAKLSAGGKLETKLCLYFATAREWNVITNDHSGPTSEIINQDTVFITHLRHEYDELRGGRADYSVCNCPRCGSGPHVVLCSSCGSNLNTSLPLQIVDYVTRLGFRFAVDPALARVAERAAWELSTANEKRDRAAQERRQLEARLAEVRQIEQDATTASTTANQHWEAGKAALGAVVKGLDEAAATAEENRKATRRQKDAQRRQRQQEVVPSTKGGNKAKARKQTSTRTKAAS